MKVGILPYWDYQKGLLIEDRYSSWDFGQIVRHWKARLGDFSLEPLNIFSKEEVHDPKNPIGRESQRAWWPAGQAREQRIHIQEHFDRYPGTRGNLNPYTERVGEIQTLEYLWSARASEADVCAVLLAASLFSRIDSARGRYPSEYWPPCSSVAALYALIKNFLYNCDGIQFDGWHQSCTNVLPDRNEDYYYRIDSVLGLINYLAEEHASVLLRYQPTEIIFTSTRDPFIGELLDRKYKVEDEERKLWKEERKKALEQEKLNQRKLLEAHPKWGQFDRLSVIELTRLVWSSPVSRIAKDYGLSDVAIGKRCKKLGIEKPPRGFWAKVAAGKLPDPKGVPMLTERRPTRGH